MKKNKGFTLIELLVVISILGVLLALSIFGMQGARESSRDGRRKADLEQIKSGLEMYRADCNAYPTTLGTTLKGSGTPSTCPVSNVYISSVPVDPTSTTRKYAYTSDGTTYALCAALEQSLPSVTGCGGGCTATCNYKITNP